MMGAPQLDFYTISQASAETGLSYAQIIYRIRAGKIKAHKAGWIWLISPKELKKLRPKGG